MDHILAFFSDLILFTAGLVVVLLWMALMGAIAIEIYDSFKGTELEEEEEDY